MLKTLSIEHDNENYFYFIIKIITHTVPEPPPATYLQRLSKRIPEIEVLGPVIHLDDAIKIRVNKSDGIDIKGLIDGFESINGVARAELIQPGNYLFPAPVINKRS
jgi:hypothetical protein